MINGKKANNINGWSIEYKKGLAALESEEYSDIIKKPNLLKIKFDDDAKESLEAWFGKDSNLRKIRLIK